MGERVRPVKGTRVLLPDETVVWTRVEQAAREIFGSYGFGEIRTPILEHTELFSRSVGESTDIVGKEMFTFPDRKGRSLTLRPEGTAPVVRAFVERGMASGPLPQRLFYIGPFFRYERPQRGRYRQFSQIGAEILGDAGPLSDAELIAMLMRFLRELGHADLEVLVNTVGDVESRQAYRDALLRYLAPHRSALSEESARRLETNPLRILDSKDPGDRTLLEGAPGLEDSLSEASRAHFEAVVEALARLGIEVTRSARLVRGLDYYTRTVFEIVSAGLGSQDAIVGGGRYDDLVAELGGPALPAIGFAIGEDRLVETLPPGFVAASAAAPPVMAVPIGETATVATLEIAETLRDRGVAVILERPDRSLGKSLKSADRQGLEWVLLLGDDEMERGTVTLKNLADGTQESVASGEVAERLARRSTRMSRAAGEEEE
jgi:histidyl-tRNA synthetase